MPTEPIEVPDPQAQLPPEPVADATPVAEPQAEQQEEYVPYRHGEFEAELPLSALQVIAEKLGYDNPAAIVNQLRNGADAQEISKQARTIYQQARQAAQRAQQYQAQTPVEQRWQQFQQQYGQQPQQRQPVDSDPDPIALLSDLRAEVRQMREDQARREQAEYNRKLASLEREATQEYQKFVADLKKKGVPEWKIPDRDYLLSEAEMMGMYHGEVSVGDMYRNIYRMMNADDIAQAAATNAVQSHVERMRDPRARVTVPVARPAPAPQPQGNPIDSMRISDILQVGEKI